VNILAIDPGPVESAYVLLGRGEIREHAKVTNHMMLRILANWHAVDFVVIEKPVHYHHMHIKMEPMYDTLRWIGRFEQHLAWLQMHDRLRFVTRKDVASHVCRAMTGKLNDAAVRQAMLDRWGPQTVPVTAEEQAGIPKSKRRKSKPGPTHGITKDQWAALAVATWWLDTGGKQ